MFGSYMTAVGENFFGFMNLFAYDISFAFESW